MIKAWINNSYNGWVETWIWANSLSLTKQVFVKAVAGVVSLAWVWADIVWVNNTVREFASDNETVAKAKVSYTPTKLNKEYIVDITWWTITIADEWKYFDLLASSDVVDWASESATVWQLKLTRFITATKCAFEIANA